MRRNTPELWDELWEKPLSSEQDAFALAKEEHTIRWHRIAREILNTFGSFQGLKVIELGAGSGTYAALMAKRGADVTILDYSDGALERGREFFKRANLKAEFIKQDALNLDPSLLQKFDVSLSFGLAEHFNGPARNRIIHAHLKVLKAGGIAFLSVPNKYCLPYQVFKFVAQRTGKWIFGEEYPYSYFELGHLARQLGIVRFSILGSSLAASFDFINPFKALAIVRRIFRLKDNLDPSALRDEHGTPLDCYLSYAIVLAAHVPRA